MFDEETIVVLGKRLLGGICAEDVVAWANAELALGKDTPTLRILASSGPPFHWSEVEDAFLLTLSELGIEPPAPDLTLWRYAEYVAQQLLNDKIGAVQACQIISQVYIQLDYPRELAVWDNLDDAWLNISSGHKDYLTPAVTRDNFPDRVRNEAAEFLARPLHGA